MKIKLLLVLIAVSVLSLKSYGQFSFGVSPGLSFNSAYFGIKMNKVVPFIGFQYAKGKMKFEESGQEFDYDLNQIVSYSFTGDASLNLYIPNIGAKFFIVEKNKLQGYLSVCLSKPILSGKMSSDGEEDTDFKDEINSISLFGAEGGFGVEYFFDDNFSIGGEFGLRYLHVKQSDSYDTQIFNPNTGNYEDSNVETEYNLGFNPTYSKISLNFYF